MTTSRGLARAGMVVSGAFLASRVLGWVRLVVIGNLFGASAELDAFFAAFRIPDLLFQLVAAGALSSALIPVISGLLAAGEAPRAWRVVSTVIDLMLIGLAILAALAFIFAPQLVGFIATGFDAETTATTIELTRIMLLSPIFLALGAVATSVLNARDRFAAAAVAPIVYNLAIIGAAVLLAPSMGVVGLAIGVVAGSLGHLLVQIAPLRAVGFRYRPVLETADPAARRAIGLMVPRAIGLGASQITFVVVTALASTLGVGAVTAITVAFTLLQIPIGVIGVPLGIVLFPSMSRDVATGDIERFVHLLGRALRLLVVVMLPIAVLASILRAETVALLFRTFDATAVAQTAGALAAFLVGLVAHAAIAVLARAFYAQQDTRTPVLAAIGAVIVNVTLAVLFVEPLRLPGIALAIAIAAWLEAGTLALLLRARLTGFRLGPVVEVAARAILATIVAAGLAIVARSVLQPLLAPELLADGLAAWIGLAALMGLVTAIFAAAFWMAGLALRITELRSIVGLMSDALRRQPRS